MACHNSYESIVQDNGDKKVSIDESQVRDSKIRKGKDGGVTTSASDRRGGEVEGKVTWQMIGE